MTTSDCRVASGLSQAALAARARTTQSVISRLESADYDGHSLSMLARIAHALGRQVRVEFVDLQGTRKRNAEAPSAQRFRRVFEG